MLVKLIPVKERGAQPIVPCPPPARLSRAASSSKPWFYWVTKAFSIATRIEGEPDIFLQYGDVLFVHPDYSSTCVRVVSNARQAGRKLPIWGHQIMPFILSLEGGRHLRPLTGYELQDRWPHMSYEQKRVLMRSIKKDELNKP